MPTNHHRASRLRPEHLLCAKNDCLRSRASTTYKKTLRANPANAGLENVLHAWAAGLVDCRPAQNLLIPQIVFASAAASISGSNSLQLTVHRRPHWTPHWTRIGSLGVLGDG